MNLQISLLVLGILAIVAIYFFSQLQDKKRKANKPAREAEHSDRNSSGDDAMSPTFVRSEPGFGVGDGDSGEQVPSLNALQPPVIGDYVDAENATGEAALSIHDNQVGVDHQSKTPTGMSTAINYDVDNEAFASEIDDIPMLENIVHSNSSGQDSGYRPGDEFDDEIDVLSDMVEPPVAVSAADAHGTAPEGLDSKYEQYESPDKTIATAALDEPVYAGEDAEVEIPTLLESEIVVSESSLNPEPQLSQVDDQDVEEIEKPITLSEEQFVEDVEDVEDPEADYAEARPSLKAFLNSIGPINKLKANIQNQLDSVKAERERVHSGVDRAPVKQPDILVESDTAVPPEFPEQSESVKDTAIAEDFSATGHEFVIDSDNGTAASSVDNSPQIAQPISAVSESVKSVENTENTNDETLEVMPSDTTPSQGSAGTSRIVPAEGFDKLSQIDYYVKLSGERDVSRDSVLAIYREGAAGISRTHSIYGLRLPEKVWRDLEHESEDARFGDLVVTIQLVDQLGLVTENDMTRFSSLIMKLSESTGRGFSFMAPIENAHRQAQAIERFKQQFDSIFVVNIRPIESEMFEGAVIDRCAKQIGLTADDNQFFARYKPVGKQKVCLYSLANMSDTGEFDLDNMRAVRTRGVTFFTRPAINRSPGAVFAEMVDAAKAFASRIKGEVIAPGYDDLSTEDVEAIRRSIEKVAAEMESYGINPGSEEATRLFG